MQEKNEKKSHKEILSYEELSRMSVQEISRMPERMSEMTQDERDETKQIMRKRLEYLEEVIQAIKEMQSKRRDDIQGLTENWEILFISLLADIFLPSWAREEWRGDLNENYLDLLSKGRPRWVLILSTLAACVQMGWALLSIKYQDLVSSKKERQVK